MYIPAMDVRSIELPAADGFALRGTLYDAQSDSALIMASATGVKRRYYDAFARFVAERGTSVVTFDYRGIGDSRPASLRGFAGTMRDWGRLDLTGAIDWISQELHPKSLVLAGHSAGGQIVGMAPNADRIDRLVFVCAQSGYWRHWPGFGRWRLGFLWYTMPLISRLAGYFPSRLVGLGSEDLPRGVASQWAHWGRHPEYLFSDTDPRPYAKLTAPILAWSFADDTYAPRPAVDALLEHYSGATITRRHLEGPGVGHFGFFRQAKGEVLWNETIGWLRSMG
jgi:predicted alpha/beta hydrolase